MPLVSTSTLMFFFFYCNNESMCSINNAVVCFVQLIMEGKSFWFELETRKNLLQKTNKSGSLERLHSMLIAIALPPTRIYHPKPI